MNALLAQNQCIAFKKLSAGRGLTVQPMQKKNEKTFLEGVTGNKGVGRIGERGGSWSNQ